MEQSKELLALPRRQWVEESVLLTQAGSCTPIRGTAERAMAFDKLTACLVEEPGGSRSVSASAL